MILMVIFNEKKTLTDNIIVFLKLSIRKKKLTIK